MSVSQSRSAGFQQGIERDVVADVTGVADQTAEKETFPQLSFHHTLRFGYKRHQQHDIEQRRMIGDDETPGALQQLLLAFDAQLDEAGIAQHSHIRTKKNVYDILIALAPLKGGSRYK